MGAALVLAIEAMVLVVWLLSKEGGEAEVHFRVIFALCALLDIVIAIGIGTGVSLP